MLILLAAAAPLFAASPTDMSIQGLKTEHAALRTELDAVEARVGGLAAASADRRASEMAEIVRFVKGRLNPHAIWEEQRLYGEIDARAGTDIPEPFTAALRHNHAVALRWTGELEKMAAERRPDVDAFVRRADNLIGLTRAHFESEEAVLVPILAREPDTRGRR